MSIPRLVRILGRNGRDVLVAALVIVSLMLSSFSPAYAAGGVTGSLTGTVVDSATGKTLSGAKISIAAPTGTYQATTDAKGNFSILGVSADTYTLSISAPGHKPLVQSGVSVVGDQIVNLQQIKVEDEGLTTIANSRSTASQDSVFKRGQTQDIITIGGGRIAQTVGHQGNTNEQSLVLAAPGATITASGGITIRGGLKTETGYNFDGVPYNEPFFSGNGGGNGGKDRFTGIASAQIVEGAGDASQGNIAGGAVNLGIKRGTYPGFGLFDAELGGPNSFQQGALEYGIATRDNRFSNYFSYTQSNEHPYYGSKGLDPTAYGNFFAADRITAQDLIDNFVFKFGHNNNQSLQFLYENRDNRSFGFAGSTFQNGANPFVNYQVDPRVVGVLGYAGFTGGLQNLFGILPTFPGQTSISQRPDAQPETSFNPTQLVKFEYDNILDANNSLQFRVYNTSFVNGTNDYFSNNSTNPTYQATGGRRAGFVFDFQHQVGTRYTFSLNLTGENQHPQWNGLQPTSLYNNMLNLPNGVATAGPSADMTYANSGATTSLADFLTPVNGQCPVSGGCYLSNFYSAANAPKLPIGGIDYGNTLFQTFGIGIRNQYQFGERVKADIGLRYEGAIYRYGDNKFNPQAYDTGNPSDVPADTLPNSFMNPRAIEPRASVAFEINRDNSVRVGYGRSAIFLNAQTAGTPAALYNYGSLDKIPATDSAANPQCGSGTNPRLVTAANPLGLFKCQNYAEQLYWLWDQNNDAPDLGAATLQIASNYDFTYQHQFKGGFGLRFTPFFKLSTGVPSFAVKSVVTDPNTGAIISEVFTANNLGSNRTTGAELGLSTPDRLFGGSGFFSATYQNVLDSAPPLISGEDSLPIITSGSLALNDIYRAGYVSPFSMRFGGDYKFKNGLRIAPVVQYNIGYPFSVGTTTASKTPVLGNFTNLPQTNNPAAVSSVAGAFGATGAQLATQYLDPANPGNALNPNIAATRGTPATTAAGGKLSPANLEGDLTVEYKSGRNTFGVQAFNLFGTQYNGVIPQVNPYYQPVSTGVAGPQTGQLKQANPAFVKGAYVDRGYANLPTNSYAFSNGAYLLAPSNPTNFRFYYQLGL